MWRVASRIRPLLLAGPVAFSITGSARRTVVRQRLARRLAPRHALPSVWATRPTHELRLSSRPRLTAAQQGAIKHARKHALGLPVVCAPPPSPRRCDSGLCLRLHSALPTRAENPPSPPPPCASLSRTVHKRIHHTRSFSALTTLQRRLGLSCPGIHPQRGSCRQKLAESAVQYAPCESTHARARPSGMHDSVHTQPSTDHTSHRTAIPNNNLEYLCDRYESV